MMNDNTKEILMDPTQILKDVVHLDSGAKVADLGCGAMAYFTLAAAKIVGNNGLVYAVDIQKEVLSSVESKAKLESLHNITTIWSNLEISGATKVPIGMDICILVTTLFQNSNHLQIMNESVRLLADGGKLLIIEWLPQKTTIGPDVSQRVPSDIIKQHAESIGLKMEKEFAAGQYHYGLIFTK
jgi:ubiquinone/menaquinone biosynthesis C-methylase UbiE